MTNENAPVANEVVRSMVNGPEDGRTYHPSFSFSDADTVLRSADGIFFRVHSHALRMTCGFFRDMFTRPRGAGGRDQGTIQIEETGIVLEKFLEIIYCMESPAWKSRIEVRGVLLTAEKYQARGVISRIRPLLLTPLFTDSPLELYSLAAHFDFEAEAKHASRLSLSLDIYDGSQERVLRTIRSKYLTRLVIFHEERKRLFCRSLNKDGPFRNFNRTGDQFIYDSCYANCYANNDAAVASWQMFEARILAEMNKRPLGDTVTGEGMTNWDEARICWQMRCTKCSGYLFELEV